MTINRRHLIVLTLLSLLARLPLMGDAFWYDEQYTLLLSRMPFARMLAATAGDVHPPLHYLITWIITQMGAPAWALRVPSLLFSLASIWLLALVMDKLGIDKRIQYGALVLMAVAPMQIHYGTEARMYALLMVLTLAATYAVLTSRWVLVWLTVTALAYTQNWGLFYGATLGLVALIRYRSNLATLRLAMAAFVGAALCWLPWANVLMGQMGTINQTYWIVRVSAGQVLYHLYQSLWSVTLPNPIAIVITIGWLLVGLRAMYRQCGAGYIYLLAFGPLTMAVVISLAWQPVMLFRAMIGLAPFLYIILASPVTELFDTDEFWQGYRFIRTRHALLAMIIFAPLVMLSTSTLYTPNGIRGDQHLYSALASQVQPGDTVITSNDGGVIGMRAITGTDAILLKECKPSLGALSVATRKAMGYDIRTWDQIPSGRVWLLWAQTPLVAKCEQDMYAGIIGAARPAILGDDMDMIKTAVYLLEK